MGLGSSPMTSRQVGGMSCCCDSVCSEEPFRDQWKVAVIGC